MKARMSHLSSRSIILPLLLLALPFPLNGCAGYWSTRRTSSASFVAERVPAGETARPLPLELLVLGGARQNTDVLGALTRLKSNARATAFDQRALKSADCGLFALHANGLATAEEMLDDTIRIVSSVSEEGEAERSASSLKGNESDKTFKGEPHERVIVYIHRGLLFLVRGDTENAHACFLTASLQDLMAEDTRDRGDWVVADRLTLLCKRQMGLSSSEEFAEQCRQRYANHAGLLDHYWDRVEDPVVLFVGAGRGPWKTTVEDEGGDVRLGYVPTPSRITRIRVRAAGIRADLPVCDDVYVQAVTRGRRAMDDQLAHQQRVIDGLESVGTGVRIAGTAVAIGRTVQAVSSMAQAAQVGQSAGQGIPGLGLIVATVAELVAAGVEEAIAAELSEMNTQADLRTLHALPSRLHLAILDRHDLGGGVIAIEALGQSGAVIASTTLNSSNFGESPPVIVGLAKF